MLRVDNVHRTYIHKLAQMTREQLRELLASGTVVVVMNEKLEEIGVMMSPDLYCELSAAADRKETN